MSDNDLTASSAPDAATDMDQDEEGRYIPVVEMLLDRTTPLDLPSIDIGWLAQLDRKRKRRRAAAASVAAVAAVVGLTAGTLALASGTDRPPDVGIAPAGPDGQPLTEPVGAWRQAADPPFEPRSDAFAGTLSDGRMIVWGGHNGAGDPKPGSSDPVPMEHPDGGLYDPATDTWEWIPPAPIPPLTGTRRIAAVHLVDDRLAVLIGGAGGNVTAAVYDVAEGRWVEAPDQSAIPNMHDAVAWDGETLVLVRTTEGEAQLEEPVTLRWELGEDEWTAGAPFPHGVRNLIGSASDGARIAVWGGTPEEVIDMDEPREVYGDGAIYDVAEDTWKLILEGPLTPGANAEVTWSNGSLLIGSRTGEEARYERPADLASYDPLSDTWKMLPASPDGGAGVVGRGTGHKTFVEGDEALVAHLVPTGGPQPSLEINPRWLFIGGAWELAPLPGLGRIGDFVVADPEDGLRAGSLGSAPYELKVRVGPDEWFDAAEAPFDNHDTLAKASNDSMMLAIVSGEDEEAPPTEHDVWVFDLTG